MGAQVSNLNSIAKNEYLDKLIDMEHITEMDPFWNQLLSFQFKLAFSSSNSKLLDESIALYCQKFYDNNLKSNNFSSLIRAFCRRANEIKTINDNNTLVLQTTNSLLMIRSFAKFLIEVDSENVFISQISTKSAVAKPSDGDDVSINSNNQALASNSIDINADESSSDYLQQRQTSSSSQCHEILYQLINSLFEICISVPVEAHTYNLHLEALNTIIVLLSIQMFEKKPIHESLIYATFMLKFDHLVSDFVKSLLRNIIQQIPCPTTANNGANRTMLSSVASGLWTVMTLGLSSSSTEKPTEQTTSKINDVNLNTNETLIDCTNRLLALQSCHILLILSNHCTNESFRNPYRLALFHFTDTQDTPTNLPNSEEPLPWFSFDYTKLYNTFCQTMHVDQYTLLLYMLLHRNQHFKMFILSRFNIDCLIVPILKVIYSASEKNSHHIYMALIILLILSEDDLFNKSIHTIMIKKLTWYTERSISEISLGGLLILVVIRTIQFNMTRMRDKYLHTNCLAALANMSSKFHSLHSYVCQKINSLLNLLTKKQAKLVGLLNSQEAANNGVYENNEEAEKKNFDNIQDLAILEELMRMVLEIINSCLINAIHHNSNLVYSLLYNKTSFQSFQEHSMFQDLYSNIDLVINHFSHEIENIEEKSVERLKEIIEFGIKQFPRDRFKKFPELKFKYVEEDQPEEFFVPYVWSLVYQSSGLYWIDRSVKLYPVNNIENENNT